LIELTKEAPTHQETRSATTFTNRRLTENELNAWIEEYHELGGINAFEFEVIRLINEIREEHGLNALAISPALSMAARFHTQEQIDLEYFSHTSPVYPGLSRLDMFGHVNTVSGRYGAGENISAGRTIPQDVLNGWMNSAGHRNAVLNPDWVSVGVGSLDITNGRLRRTTAKFGS